MGFDSIMPSYMKILLRSKQKAKFFDFLDENRPLFVVLSDRLVVTAAISGMFEIERKLRVLT